MVSMLLKISAVPADPEERFSPATPFAKIVLALFAVGHGIGW
jgi:hypothetical protein